VSDRADPDISGLTATLGINECTPIVPELHDVLTRRNMNRKNARPFHILDTRSLIFLNQKPEPSKQSGRALKLMVIVMIVVAVAKIL
jgi:hypothetical protein